MRIWRKIIGLVLISAGLFAQENPDRWEPEIAAFEAADRANAPAKGGIVFTGSSSIRYWEDLSVSFPGKNALNRGFGGSQIDDLTRYVDRIIYPYQPRQVVIYSGDNDIAAGESAEEVADDFSLLFRKIRSRLPAVYITYLAIKPSPSRVQYLPEVIRANQLIRQFLRKERRTDFVDVFSPMLDAGGKPRAELFREDSLHLNAKGYQEWATLVGPYLK